MSSVKKNKYWNLDRTSVFHLLCSGSEHNLCLNIIILQFLFLIRSTIKMCVWMLYQNQESVCMAYSIGKLFFAIKLSSLVSVQSVRGLVDEKPWIIMGVGIYIYICIKMWITLFAVWIPLQHQCPVVRNWSICNSSSRCLMGTSKKEVLECCLHQE